MSASKGPIASQHILAEVIQDRADMRDAIELILSSLSQDELSSVIGRVECARQLYTFVDVEASSVPVSDTARSIATAMINVRLDYASVLH